MNADGSAADRLTHNPASDGYPNFSPDGRRILFDSDRDGNFDIYAMDATGAEVKGLTQNPGRDVSASWSPDGRQIAFMSDRTGEFEVWMMAADGSDQRRVTDRGSCWFPRWSPDGTKLAFHVGRDIRVLDLKGTNLARLTTDPDNGMYPDWSPDGKRLVFMSWRTGRTEIFVMDSDGSHQRRLTHTREGDVIDPRWSPDGQSILFVHVPKGMQAGGPRAICVMNADGTGIRRLSRAWISVSALRNLFVSPVEPARAGQ